MAIYPTDSLIWRRTAIHSAKGSRNDPHTQDVVFAAVVGAAVAALVLSAANCQTLMSVYLVDTMG